MKLSSYTCYLTDINASNLQPRNLGGIPAITFADSAIEPVMKIMKVADMSLCVLASVWLTIGHILHT